jgi:uncharacterized protein (TIGR02246 family)
MRAWFLCICIVFALLCLVFAQRSAGGEESAQSSPSSNATAEPQIGDVLETNVRAAWRAFKNKDKEGYAKFLADNFQAVEADGDGERPASRILREVEHSMYTDYLLQLFQVQQLGPNFAFVTYESTMQFPQGPAARYRRVFIGELWIRQDGQWKMMRYQETPVR